MFGVTLFFGLFEYWYHFPHNTGHKMTLSMVHIICTWLVYF